MPKNSNPQRERLRQNYAQLDALGKTIVQVLAIAYQDVSASLLSACLYRTGLREINKGFQLKNLKPVLDKLAACALLEGHSANIGLHCNPLFAEEAARMAQQEGNFDKIVAAVRQIIPAHHDQWGGRIRYRSKEIFVREARLALYEGNINTLKIALDGYYNSFHQHYDLSQLFANVYFNPFDKAWFAAQPEALRESALAEMLRSSLASFAESGEVFDYLRESSLPNITKIDAGTRSLLTTQLLLRGEWDSLQAALSQADGIDVAAGRGWLAMLRGDEATALAEYQKAHSLYAREHGGKTPLLSGPSGIFYVLLLLKNSATYAAATAYLEALERHGNPAFLYIFRHLSDLAKRLRGNVSAGKLIHNGHMYSQEWGRFTDFILCLCQYWLEPAVALQNLAKIERLSRDAEQAGYRWIAAELCALAAELDPKKTKALEKSRAFQDSNASRALLHWLHCPQSWELSLQALIQLNRPAAPDAAAAERQARLVWLLSHDSLDNTLTMQPREQKIAASGSWSKGRQIALKRLSEEHEDMDFLTEQDHRVCRRIRMEQEHSGYGYYHPAATYRFEVDAAKELMGHPLLFWEASPTIRVDLVKGEPELLVRKQKGDKLLIQLLPDALEADQPYTIVKESPTRLKLIEVKDSHRQILEILGKGIQVPAAAGEKVLEAIGSLASLVTVHSDIGGGAHDIEEVASDPNPRLHLLPLAAGLKAALLVRPFTEAGPYYPPGHGGETVIAEVGEKRLQTRRDLKQEKRLAKEVIEACPILREISDENGEWALEEPETALELLLQIQPLGEKLKVEWPEGEKFKLRHQASLQQFHLRIRREQDWFSASGEVRLDDQEVIDMQRMLELLGNSKSRFIPLGNGEFMALTQEFRKRLDDLKAYSEPTSKGLKFHPLAALALEELTQEVGDFKADAHWQKHLQRLREAQDLQPVLPSTLQAELRDYQLDGYCWLARLAHWGVGACLADDMGLGKTLQALALMLSRAEQGPALVIAPTSVCANWEAEAQRFAPTLNTLILGAGDRKKMLKELKPFDLLICSYGLLQQEQVGEMLAEISFQTIAIDEAQAIKNLTTRRSQAAMNLQGDFKLITTGTPIENHLGELWNLFRFINPGLLGSLEKFNQRFANPIEKLQDRNARNQLKKLIQPFILRRTKSQVLEELPPRTEILLHVELSKEEHAFYEALRRQALERLAHTQMQPGQRHLQILAEIMKLRRSCCNTRLVLADATLPSAKLAVFAEVVEELLDNKHKALVFSQFVDHLSLIREYLDAQKISYQYLDGSTPTRERKARVDAFQAGKGDVFLISLKAGGVGLNLTAADYVIHMDPWWNPAVEDQASDRAHRIGQHRPVTIYRLVAKDTIEEKIVAMHAHKRDLADSLLEGSDMSGKISTDELLKLMQAE
jgi:SNF2 family DNA or RNA helicase